MIDGWRDSAAVTPDLLPRIVFTLRVAAWDDTVWALQRLCGPGALALRPRLWRCRFLGTSYKKGPWASPASYRLLCVMGQMGLLQEGLLFRRLKSPIRASLGMGQSGYARDAGDTHLVMHELVASYRYAARPLWIVHGDFVHAFPRSWRALLMDLLHAQGGVRGGALSLLGSILEWDEVVVALSGLSVV